MIFCSDWLEGHPLDAITCSTIRCQALSANRIVRLPRLAPALSPGLSRSRIVTKPLHSDASQNQRRASRAAGILRSQYDTYRQRGSSCLCLSSTVPYATDFFASSFFLSFSPFIPRPVTFPAEASGKVAEKRIPKNNTYQTTPIIAECISSTPIYDNSINTEDSIRALRPDENAIVIIAKSHPTFAFLHRFASRRSCDYSSLGLLVQRWNLPSSTSSYVLCSGQSS